MTFQSSTRQTDFATLRGLGEDWQRISVSILYEADRLCNPPPHSRQRGYTRSFNPLRGRQTLQLTRAPDANTGSELFQSSTRQTDFATWRRVRHGVCSNLLFQSSTRQTDFATRAPGRRSGWSGWFQSSTRQTDFATHVAPQRPHLYRVSILYEADRLCNAPGPPGPLWP